MNSPSSIDSKPIRNALISVYHKEGLDEIIQHLSSQGIQLFSTGGTQQYIESLGAEVHAVEQLTSYPSILGGRVKTLHPKVFGGILGRRELEDDIAQLEQYEIPAFDLVVVDLYPFEATVASGATDAEIIEKIDIGGISLIRAAAKNFKDVLVIPSQKYYGFLRQAAENGSTTLAQRKQMAAAAFGISSSYDTAIGAYFNATEKASGNGHGASPSEGEERTLRYGENPHQEAVYQGNLAKVFDQLHGKEISYNNLLDIHHAVALMADFQEADPTMTVLKHNNACGFATRPTQLEAWKAALAGDPVSAFGGIIIANKPLNLETAEAVNELFCEVVIAPGYEAGALEALQTKKNRILLALKQFDFAARESRTILGGTLTQDRDQKVEDVNSLTTATKLAPSDEQLKDLLFANKLVKHTKSNAIVLAKGGQLLGSGTGQCSRVDALKQAIDKAGRFGFDLSGAVMASDAFFPFSDCVELAHQAGIKAVIQPGGSKRDQDSIDFCDQSNMTMVYTGTRHFKH